MHTNIFRDLCMFTLGERNVCTCVRCLLLWLDLFSRVCNWPEARIGHTRRASIFCGRRRAVLRRIWPSDQASFDSLILCPLRARASRIFVHSIRQKNIYVCISKSTPDLFIYEASNEIFLRILRTILFDAVKKFE